MPPPTTQTYDMNAILAQLANVASMGQGFLAYLPRSLRGKVFDPFAYTADFTSAVFTSLAVVTVPIAIQADSHFLATSLAATTFDTTGQTLQTTQLYKVQISDAGSGRNWFSAPVFGNAVTGNGTLPFPLQPPKLVKAAATLNVQLSSTDTTNAHVVQIAIHGFKVFNMARDAQAPGT